MKRFLLAIVCVCFAVSVAQAQTSNQTLLKLKSGVEVRGEIVELIPDVSITLKDANGDLFYYRMDEVARFEMGKQEKSKIRESKGLGNFKGYRGVVDVNWNRGGDGNNKSLHYQQINVSFINGYNFGSYLFIGLGVGVSFSNMNGWCGECYNDDHEQLGDHIDLPIFLHLRSSFLKNRRVSPFVALSAGYNINCKTAYRDGYHATIHDDAGNYFYPAGKFSGVYIEPSLGAEFRINRKHAISLALTLPIVPPTEKTRGRFIMKNVGAKIGYSF